MNETNARTGNIGDVLMIFEDPITRLKPEGEARILDVLRDRGSDGGAFCTVEFLDEPGTVYDRTIYGVQFACDSKYVRDLRED